MKLSVLRFVIDFCQLGFIGKMFKAVELPWLVQFFLMFYNDKPGASLILCFFYFHTGSYKVGNGCKVDLNIIPPKSSDNIDLLPVDWLLENLIQTKVRKLDPFDI